MLKIGLITLFPEMFEALEYSIPGRAQKQNLISLDLWNPRDFTTDKHRTVDDRPYGGGPGMLMKVEPLLGAIQAAKAKLGQDSRVIYLSPQGKPFDQNRAQSFSNATCPLIFIAGRYEGVDERIIESAVDEECSIGDYVLSGGEFAAMSIIDAVSRLIPGVLGDKDSADQDSFSHGLLDHPHYTRPETINGLSVPSVLLSGNHAEIERWRLEKAIENTRKKRPDLLKKLQK